MNISFGSDNVGWQIMSIQIQNKEYLADFVKDSTDQLNTGESKTTEFQEVVLSSAYSPHSRVDLMA